MKSARFNPVGFPKLDVAARGGNFVVAVVDGLSGRRENRQPIFG